MEFNLLQKIKRCNWCKIKNGDNIARISPKIWLECRIRFLKEAVSKSLKLWVPLRTISTQNPTRPLILKTSNPTLNHLYSKSRKIMKVSIESSWRRREKSDNSKESCLQIGHHHVWLRSSRLIKLEVQYRQVWALVWAVREAFNKLERLRETLRSFEPKSSLLASNGMKKTKSWDKKKQKQNRLP